MIVIRLMLVAVLIATGALALTWLFTRDSKYLGYLNRVLRFALIVGLVAALVYVVERVVLL